MIRKPTAEWSREGEGALKVHAVVTDSLKSLTTGARVLQDGAKTVQGYVSIAFGVLWIVAGLAAGLGGSFPTLIGASLLGSGAVWLGRRRVRKGKAGVRDSLGLPEVAPRPKPSATLAAAPESGARSSGARSSGARSPIALSSDAGAAPYAPADALACAFDADAIIARHLAEKERLAVSAQVEPVPLVHTGLPVRPAFGRKVA